MFNAPLTSANSIPPGGADPQEWRLPAGRATDPTELEALSEPPPPPASISGEARLPEFEAMGLGSNAETVQFRFGMAARGNPGPQTEKTPAQVPTIQMGALPVDLIQPRQPATEPPVRASNPTLPSGYSVGAARHAPSGPRSATTCSQSDPGISAQGGHLLHHRRSPSSALGADHAPAQHRAPQNSKLRRNLEATRRPPPPAVRSGTRPARVAEPRMALWVVVGVVTALLLLAGIALVQRFQSNAAEVRTPDSASGRAEPIRSDATRPG